MVVSEKRRIANRANAAKSTGPKTEEGKARSSRNAVTHGLTAKSCLLPGEDPGAYQTFEQAMLLDLAPAGMMQLQIVHRIIHLSWKLQRVCDAEVEYMNSFNKDLEYYGRPPATPAQALAKEAFQEEETGFLRLQKYEQRLERMVQANLRELHRLRKEAREENEAIDEEHDEFAAEDAEDAEKTKEEIEATTEENDKTKPLLEEELAPSESSSAFSASSVANASSSETVFSSEHRPESVRAGFG